MARIRRYMGRVEVWLEPGERTALAATVAALADGAGGGPRLLPHAYDDPALEREYQRLSASEVEAVRAADVATLREDLDSGRDPVRLDEDRALSWLRALNVLRLVAGGRLGIDTDGWELDADPARLESEDYAMLLDLAWVQEAIIEAL